MNRGFWDKLEWPVVGLAPMDGVTDAAFRYVVAKYGRNNSDKIFPGEISNLAQSQGIKDFPGKIFLGENSLLRVRESIGVKFVKPAADRQSPVPVNQDNPKNSPPKESVKKVPRIFPSLFITEFTNVEGLARGVAEMLKSFIYSEIERPVVGQVYGVEVDSFYKSTLMLCALGFDGIDINMGCPANKVAKHGSGAGLIRTPDLAKKIVLSCKKACKDWSEGITLQEAKIPDSIIQKIEEMQPQEPERKQLPVSVKTRIGYENAIVEEWINHLLEVRPANITLHGRTLRQMYLGKADWEEIAKAAQLCKGSGVTLIGNGDIENLEDAFKKIADFGVDGVLIGRATFGNPWLFNGHEPSVEERFAVLLKHARYFTQLNYSPFHVIKKHLAWYCKGFDRARELRMKLMGTTCLEDTEKVVEEFRKL